MNVLIACEESQAVCIEFRKRGHMAFSADIQECSGGNPQWHILGDVIPLLNGNCKFKTQDGTKHYISGPWDLIIAHPPCTYLSNAGTRSFSLRCTPAEKIIKRWENRARAAVFFMKFFESNAKKICVENPVGFMNTAYRKPDCIIDPYMFSNGPDDSENYVTKRTCFWLRGLEPLKPTYRGEKPNNSKLFGNSPRGKSYCWPDTFSRDPKIRSKTFKGIAQAMAEQWGMERW